MAVIDELAGGKNRGNEFGAVDDRIETALQQADQVLAGVATAARRFFVDLAELAFPDIAVVALEPLLGHQLRAVFRRLATALAMLARAVFAIVEGALGAAPQVHLEAAVDLVFGFSALGHVV